MLHNHIIMIRLLTKSLFSIAQTAPALGNNYNFAKDIPASEPRTQLNLFQAVNSALDVALQTDQTYLPPYLALKSLEKTLNSEEFSAALLTFQRNTGWTECLTLLFQNKASLDLRSELQLLGTRVSQKFSSQTTYSLDSIK